MTRFAIGFLVLLINSAHADICIDLLTLREIQQAAVDENADVLEIITRAHNGHIERDNRKSQAQLDNNDLPHWIKELDITPEQYKADLRKEIAESKARLNKPVLFTEMIRNHNYENFEELTLYYDAVQRQLVAEVKHTVLREVNDSLEKNVTTRTYPAKLAFDAAGDAVSVAINGFADRAVYNLRLGSVYGVGHGETSDYSGHERFVQLVGSKKDAKKFADSLAERKRLQNSDLHWVVFPNKKLIFMKELMIPVVARAKDSKGNDVELSVHPYTSEKRFHLNSAFFYPRLQNGISNRQNDYVEMLAGQLDYVKVFTALSKL